MLWLFVDSQITCSRCLVLALITTILEMDASDFHSRFPEELTQLCFSDLVRFSVAYSFRRLLCFPSWGFTNTEILALRILYLSSWGNKSWDWSSCTAHVLLHLVKSSCPNSVNPFSTLFSADIQHNCPILFCICRPYFPPWLAFRFSIKKWLHLHFQGKWPLSPSSFEQLSFSLRFILQNEWKC